jgi:hypothetical protein
MLRRRKHPSNDDEGDLSERLLADDDASESHARHKSVIVYEPFSLEGFLRYVLLQCRFLVDCINRFLAYLRGSAPAAPPISPLQQQRVGDLQQKLAVQFDLDNEEHQRGLKDLWKHGFPGLLFEGFKCERWKEMGWQNQDPTTDIRGAGYFGVQNLLYMAAMHYRLFDKLMHKREGVRSEWEYPFAAAGLNITVQLAQLLELTKPGALPKSAPGRAFLVLLEVSAMAGHGCSRVPANQWH